MSDGFQEEVRRTVEQERMYRIIRFGICAFLAAVVAMFLSSIANDYSRYKRDELEQRTKYELELIKKQDIGLTHTPGVYTCYRTDKDAKK